MNADISTYEKTIISMSRELEAAGTAHCFLEQAALTAQGIEVQQQDRIKVSVQWDQMEMLYGRYNCEGAGPLEKQTESARFTLKRNEVGIEIICFYNTVVAADSYRIAAELAGCRIWVKSLYYYKNQAHPSSDLYRQITESLQRMQSENTRINQKAWNQHTYDAWIARHGTPEQAAEKIKKNPVSKLAPLYHHMGNVDGKRIINLMGSHGTKAVSLALLGADATVVDISRENAEYAKQLMEAAGVSIRYIVRDVLALQPEDTGTGYDMVLMENGILHYFVDLQPLMRQIAWLLQAGGRLVLQDFHPVSTKLITSKGKKHKVAGNYFDRVIHQTPVAFSKYLSDKEEAQLVRLRRWTLGEIVSAAAEAGLFVRVLEEEPNHKLDDFGLPKTFTLVAEKM